MNKIIIIRNINFSKFDKKNKKFFFGKYKDSKKNINKLIKKNFLSIFLFLKYILSIVYTIFFIFTFNFKNLTNIYKRGI